jgi:hypothetical protein
MAYAQLSEDGVDTLRAGGFGAILSRTILSNYLPDVGTSGLLANVLIANLPQLIFSCL